MAQLDETITTGDLGHETDHETLARKANYVFDVKDFGAVGDGSTDDTAAIQAAIDAAETAGGGVVYLPRGTYNVTGQGAGENYAVFDVHSDTTVVGDGEGATTVSLGGDPDRAYIFYVSHSSAASNVLFERFTIEGNRSAQSTPLVKFRHGFKVGHADTYKASNVTIRNVTMQHLYGDGVALELCSNVTIENCYFYDCNRDGVSMVRSGDYVTIRNNVFDTIYAQSVDSEPSTGHYDHVVVDGNYMPQPTSADNYTLTPWGTATANSVGWYVTNNTILGAVYLKDVEDCHLRGNRIVSGPSQTVGGIRIHGDCQRVVISDNDIVVTNTTPAANTGAIYAREAAGDRPVGCRIIGNRISMTDSVVVRLWGVKNYVISGNEIEAGTAAYEAIHATVFNADIDGLVISGNLIKTAGDNAVKLQSNATGDTTKNVVVADNTMVGLTGDAVLLSAGGTDAFENIMVSGNVVDQSGGVEVNAVTETIRTGTNVWVGSGTPESAVTAPIASLYVDRAGGGSTTLYVKESGTGNTGWVAK